MSHNTSNNERRLYKINEKLFLEIKKIEFVCE